MEPFFARALKEEMVHKFTTLFFDIQGKFSILSDARLCFKTKLQLLVDNLIVHALLKFANIKHADFN